MTTKTKTAFISYLCCNVFAGVLCLALMGCDFSDSGDASRNTLQISPSSTNIQFRSAAFFTVTTDTNQNVTLPLQWTVEDPSLGTIISAAGQSAVYRSNSRAGVNTVIVRDQAEKEGLAQVVISEPDAPAAPIIITNAPIDEVENEEPAGNAGNQTVNIILTNGASNATGSTP